MNTVIEAGPDLDNLIHDALFPEREHLVVDPYSINLEAAFKVVEKMRERGYKFILQSHADVWAAVFFDENMWSAHGDSVPLAICRAALMALEAENKCY